MKDNMATIFVKSFTIAKPLITVLRKTFYNSVGIMDAAVSAVVIG